MKLAHGSHPNIDPRINFSSKVFARGTALGCLLGLLVFTGACTISKDKNSNGDGDNVKISTPLGGLKVRSDETTAASLGLPAYPGAHFITKKEDGDNGSVDLHMGFGPWQMHVQVASYGTNDPEDKVLAYYKQALGRFGPVIECSGDTAVGTPSTTPEGLSCRDHEHAGSTKWNNSGVNIDDMKVELKAGSRHRQHLVGVKKKNGETRFSLIALELPNSDKEQQTD